MHYTHWFFITLLATLIIKVVFAYAIPFTGDEAYFVIWGKHVAWGYYDHPPLIGWILHGLLYISDHYTWMRLPTIITTTLIGWVIFKLLQPYSADKAALIGILYLISPLNLLGMLITTDVPLIVFAFLSGSFTFLAIKHNDHMGYYILAGLSFGLAIFSKYFAVFLGMAYLIYMLMYVRHSKRLWGFILVLALTIPFLLINIIWNYHYSWSNILFNIFNRNTSNQFDLANIFSYLLILFYIITPVICYYLVKHWRVLFGKIAATEFSLLRILFVAPLALFLLLSSMRSIGLHWPLAFIPFIYMLLFIVCNQIEIIRANKFMLGFSSLHIVLATIILSLPFSSWQQLGFNDRNYAELVFIRNHHEISEQLLTYSDDSILASPSYAKAAIIDVDIDHYTTTFGKGSVHGRQDDFIADFSQWDGQNFVIFDTKTDLADKFADYFQHIETASFQIYDANYYLLFGYDFDYAKYHQDFITLIKARYWTIPPWLPYSNNFFCEKYFDDPKC